MTKTRTVIFIEKNRIQYIYNGVLLTLDIPTDIIRDGEVIFADKLKELITSFISTNKIVPSDLVILLSDDLTFSTVIKIEPGKTSEEQVQNFIDLVPFEDVSYREFVTSTEVTIIAANHDFIQSIKIALIDLGFTVTFIISQFILAKQNIATTYSPQVADEIIKKFDVLQVSSLETEQEQIQTQQKLKEEKNFYSMKIKPTTLILFGVFGILIIVIIVMLVINLRPQTPSTPPPTPLLPTPTPTIMVPINTTPINDASSSAQASNSASLEVF